MVYLAKNIPINYLPILGCITLILGISFAYLFFSGTRQTGAEVFGDKIWWNDLRPFHSLFYLTFSYYAINKMREGWIYLLYDVILALFSFLFFHYINNNFSKFFTSLKI